MSTTDRDRHETIDGVRFRITEHGLIYDPAPVRRAAKYPCPDCRTCLLCPESKCGPCRGVCCPGAAAPFLWSDPFP